MGNLNWEDSYTEYKKGMMVMDMMEELSWNLYIGNYVKGKGIWRGLTGVGLSRERRSKKK